MAEEEDQDFHRTSTRPDDPLNSKLRLPGPEGTPFAWAETRQELCETLPYFRSFHSGCYATSALPPSSSSSQLKKGKSSRTLRDNTPYGYLLAGFGASRDAWEHKGRVIISHGGGKSGPSTSMCAEGSGNKVQLIADQLIDDVKVSCLLHSLRNQTPIVLLLGKDYKLSHFELPCAFAVLGWYWITEAWCEKEGCKGDQAGWIRWKFRFQYIESQGQPWWLNEVGDCWNPSTSKVKRSTIPTGRLKRKRTTPSSWSSSTRLLKPALLTRMPIIEHTGRGFYCPDCNQSSPLVFTRGWMCLQSLCESFWKLQGVVPEEEELQLSPLLTRLQPEPSHFSYGGLPFCLLPPPIPSPEDQGDALRGLHCTCGRLTCRQYPHYWHCASCGLTVPCYASTLLHSPTLHASTSRLEDSKVNSLAGITIRLIRRPTEDLEVGSFAFPECLGGGSIHIIQSMSGQDSKADTIFAEMQQGSTVASREDVSIPFQRHSLTCNTVKGELLSQQFTCNYGVEYKHIVKMKTVALHQAPNSAINAMDFIKGQTEKVIKGEGKNTDFNELYPVKYLEDQKMNFHDDGEPGLGPVVSSLSLGKEAKMMFRLKEKLTTDYRKRTLNEEEKEEDEKSDRSSIRMVDRLLLTIPLRHGCVAIQYGKRLQEMIEHAVQPLIEEQENTNGRIRIAVTARRIDKGNEELSSSKEALTTQNRKAMPVGSVMKLPGGAGWMIN